jgi:hypothetical protein
VYKRQANSFLSSAAGSAFVTGACALAGLAIDIGARLAKRMAANVRFMIKGSGSKYNIPLPSARFAKSKTLRSTMQLLR